MLSEVLTPAIIGVGDPVSSETLFVIWCLALLQGTLFDGIVHYMEQANFLLIICRTVLY